MINVPDSLDICPDTLGYTRILRRFTRIVWKATFSGTSGATGLTGMLYWSDRSNTVTYFYLLRGVNQSKLVWINGFILHIYLVSQPISHLKNYSKRNIFWTATLSYQGNTGLTGLQYGSDRSGLTVTLFYPLMG